jgi:hypothetical protein
VEEKSGKGARRDRREEPEKKKPEESQLPDKQSSPDEDQYAPDITAASLD